MKPTGAMKRLNADPYDATTWFYDRYLLAWLAYWFWFAGLMLLALAVFFAVGYGVVSVL